MKTVIKFLVIAFLGLGLMQLADLAFYLMNRSDGYLFNMGLILFAAIFVGFGFLGLYMLKVIKPEEEVKEEVKQEKEEKL